MHRDMTHIAIFWDAAPLWGLLVWHAATALGLPYRLVKAQEIAHGTLSDKTSLLIVPGGAGRRKSTALGADGRKALRQWVCSGGHYLGFCGGAGLGLTDDSGDGLGLCPWQRASIDERVQHLVSGHVRVCINPDHPLVPPSGHLSSSGSVPGCQPCTAQPWLEIPVWWPGRFAAPADTGFHVDGVDVLARYGSADPASWPPDLCVADLPLHTLTPDVLAQWEELYGVSLTPSFLGGQPCVLHGACGKGSYTLSYSHLETPDSPDANRWFAHLLHELAGLTPATHLIPPWNPASMPVCWEDAALQEARRGLGSLLQLGLAHGLLFERTPWLLGWRAGVPGSGLNTLFMNLCVLTSRIPNNTARALWAQKRDAFMTAFAPFRQGVENLLLAQRLATIAPEAVPRSILEQQRISLFGAAMREGGLYRDLLALSDELLFACLAQGETA